MYKFIIIYYEIIFAQYTFSKFCKIGKKSFFEYLRQLNPKQITIYENEFNIRLKWEDDFTLYIVKFSLNGDFISIEREIWYEYSLPWLKKKVLLDHFNKI